MQIYILYKNIEPDSTKKNSSRYLNKECRTVSLNLDIYLSKWSILDNIYFCLDEKKTKDSENKGTQNSGKKIFRVYGVDSLVTINAFNFTICILYRKRVLGGVEFNLKMCVISPRLLSKRVDLTSSVFFGFFGRFFRWIILFRISVSISWWLK